MTTVSASYSTEDIDVTFTANAVLSDYGVPRSPTFVEIEDVEVDEVCFLGVAVDVKNLPNDLITRLLELADEIDADDWEGSYD